ncbi:MAG: MFS transporter [Dehalococcoidia bacterium]|nr:MFS transporter [Dehalococcoidia bacterium]
MAVQDPAERPSDTTEATRSDSLSPGFGPGIFGRYFKHTFEAVIENRDFRMLWFGMVLAMGGFQMQMVAGGILVYNMTDDPFITGIVGMGFAPSLLVVSLYGGVLGDRVERRLLIQVSQAVNGILAGVVAVLLISGTLAWGHLFAVSVAQGAMFALQMPARQAAIPSLVRKDQFANAFALNAMAMSIMSLLAPAIAGVLYQQVSPEIVYIIVSVVMLSAVVFTSLVPRMYPATDDDQTSVLDDIIAGFKYIGRNKFVLHLMIYSVIVALLSMPFRMLVQVYAKDVYGSEPTEVGLLLTAIGLGGLIGSISIANLRVGHRRGWYLLGGAFVSGFALALIVGIPIYFAGVIGMVGIGLGEQARWALGQSLMMERTSDEYRARVMSVLMMTFGLMPAGLLPLGYAIREFGARESVGTLAALLLVFAILSVFMLPRLRRVK